MTTELLRVLFEEIRRARESGRSYSDIARAAGVFQPQVSYFMSGARPSMDADTAGKLCHALGIRVVPPKRPPGRQPAPESVSGPKPTFKRVR